MTRLLGAVVTAAFIAGCGARAEEPARPAAPQIGWRALGSWSGVGSSQTESFSSESGTLRVRWTAAPPTGSAPTHAPLSFRVTAHSAISGRPLQQVVESPASDNGIAYVQQDPHVFYMVVDAHDLRWTVAVEEAVALR